MAKAGYCTQCGTNVWLGEDGGCPAGHGPESITNSYDTSDSSASPPFGSLMESHVVRLVLVGLLTLVLLIPVTMIAELIPGRAGRKTQATREVTSKWGQAQRIAGPALVVPYAKKAAAKGTRGTIGYAVFLPERLRANGKAISELRYRGIFVVPVYRAALKLTGEFARPDVRELGIDPTDVQWDRARLMVGISDIRAIQEVPKLDWAGRKIALSPGVGDYGNLVATGANAAVPIDAGSKKFTFSIPLELNGSESLYFVPFGRDTQVDLSSNWASPSFKGNWLPGRRQVTDKGFQATWRIPFLGRNYPQSWTSERDAAVTSNIEASRFGVDLISPVDAYSMSERSVKYAVLFIVLTFATVWLIEVLLRQRVHPVQYLLVGAAMCIFYLLELSLSEHLPFTLAYAIAAVAIVGMVGAYAKAMLGSIGQAAIVAAVVAGLYAYLYVVLRNEDYALLVGSIGLFAVLAVIMFLTRNVDWFGAKSTTVGRENRSPQS